MEREEENPTSLTTPLNEHDIHDDDDDNDDDEDGGCRAVERERNRKEEIAKEVKKQLWLAGPLVCTSVLQFSLQLISLMYVGHLGELPLSGASMATSFATVTGFSLLTDLGLRGAALANSISYWTNVVLLALYVKFSSSCAKTWTGLSKEALHDILNFLGLAIPSAVMVCLEMWSFEMIVLASGLLPDPELQTSVLSICLNTTTTVWMITYGLGNAVSTRVSNELGAGRPYAARLAVCVVLVMAVTEAVIVGAVMISIRNIWGYAYSDVVEVVRYVAAMMPILAASNFLDALQGVLSGTVRGCGRQKAGAFVNLGSYYIVGIPSAIVFAFVLRIGGKGLWFGIICGLIVQVLSLSTITLRTNWEQQAKKATERVYDSTIPVDTVS
ncbi:protein DETOXIFICATION 16-like isoform X7 [Camellia sinensis]|uniref:protein DETOXIFICATION 16-like isoform X7 n=1 Tax=Camellia sinensis TaxID=4442 RepID=UPI001036C1FB|nr:protein DETOXIFICATION 16-like isoform X7 [Camellia sinensis]